MRKSLYRFSDDELSMLVFNTEWMYTIRHNKSFIRLLRRYYQATNKQWEVLKHDLAIDLKEIQNETKQA